MEAENQITHTVYTSANLFIALRWHSENDYGFTYEYTYHDCEYIVRTMNTKNAQCTCYTLSM